MSRLAVRGAFLGAFILGCILPESASAQWRQAPQAVVSAWSEARESPLVQTAVPESYLANSFIIATIGSAAGILVGGLIGASIEEDEWTGLIYGAAAGSALLSPTLLYLANRRGPFGRALLLSVAGTALGTYALWPNGAVLIVVPVIQIGVSVALLG